MAAKKGNNYNPNRIANLKWNDGKRFYMEWDEEVIMRELHSILDELKNDKELIFINQLFEDRPYTRFAFAKACEKFQGVAEVKHAVAKISEILESRAVVNGLNNRKNPVMTIFHLKNNYGWKDKRELETTHKKEYFDASQAAKILDAGTVEERRAMVSEQKRNNRLGNKSKKGGLDKPKDK